MKPHRYDQPAKIKESTKNHKKAWNQYSLKRNLERKNQPAKQRFTKVTKLQQRFKSILLERNLEKKQQLQYNIQL